MNEDVSKKTIAFLLVALIAVSLGVIFTSVNTKTTIIKGPVQGKVTLNIVNPDEVQELNPPTEANLGGKVDLEITKKYDKTTE